LQQWICDSQEKHPGLSRLTGAYLHAIKPYCRNNLQFQPILSNSWLNVGGMEESQRDEDYAEDIWRSLERDVFPAIGDVSVTDIKAHTLVQAVQPFRPEEPGNRSSPVPTH
jgi:hypothetical protein